MYAKFLAVAALVSYAVALPTNAGGPTVNQCNVQNQQCCNSVQSADHADTTSTINQGLNNGLLSGVTAGGILNGVSVPVGLDCTPISVLALAGNKCTAQPVCCSNNTFNGVVAIGCSPLSIL
ncbi:hypothetical protein D9756_006096 [Leucocoprinus leucothites]|uniref:Hydrophobin n=1 Tax=Leucocoprinus leucothites TaxID=201217 RepID=A0A8H5FWQ9_9AGAR|nr:hypothetical protein D9756_006096 [Leucoagaricus leucothites]